MLGIDKVVLSFKVSSLVNPISQAFTASLVGMHENKALTSKEALRLLGPIILPFLARGKFFCAPYMVSVTSYEMS